MNKIDEFLDEITIKKEGKEIVITEKKVREMLTRLIENMNKEAEFRDDFGMNAKFISLLIDVKKSFWPATLRTLQGNIDFNQSLDKWYELQKNLLTQGKKLKVYDIVADGTN